MINSLKRLVGDPPLARPNFSDWSIRTVAAIAAGQAPVPVTLTPVSLVAVARFLQNTIPSDTPPLPSGPSFGGNYFSLRSLLEPPGI